MEELIKQIKKHEGYRSRVYADSLGIDTIGIGFAIKDLELSEEVCEIILKEKLVDLYIRVKKKFPFFEKMPTEIQDCLLNQSYQLGVTGVSKFKKMLAAMQKKDWPTAADEMLDSKWAKQTPGRAKELSEIVRNFND
jgi:lysozyme